MPINSTAVGGTHTQSRRATPPPIHSVIPALMTVMHISWSITRTSRPHPRSNIPQLHWHESCWFRLLSGRLKVIGAAEWAPLGPMLRYQRRLKERTSLLKLCSHVCERSWAWDDIFHGVQVCMCVFMCVSTCMCGCTHVLVWSAEDL